MLSATSAINRIRAAAEKWTTRAGQPSSRGVPDDLRVVETGAVYAEDGLLDYLWYHLEDSGGRQYFKAVCLNVLTYLTREIRELPSLLEKMRKVLLGLYNAQVEMVILRGNLPGYGAVQVYGAQGLSTQGLEEAVASARQGLVAVRAVLANFEQSRLEPLGLDLAESMRQAFLNMHLSLVVVGHPDPREGVRGMEAGGADPFRAARRSEVGLQQTEYLLRGMLEADHPFLNVVMLSQVGDGDRRDIYLLQERVGQELTLWASKENFTRNINVGLGLPIILSGSVGDGASAGYGAGQSEGTQQSLGRSTGTAHTEGQTDATSWSKSHTVGENWGSSSTSGSSWGRTVTQTTGVANGTSHVESQAHGTADTRGSGHTSGSSWGQTTALSHGASMNQSVGGGIGIGGTGINLGKSVSESFGLTQASSVGGFSSSSSFSSHTDSQSWGTADGTSHVVSQGTAVSHSSGGFSSHTSSHGHSVADTETTGGSRATSTSDTTSQATTTAYARSASNSLARGQALTTFQGLGLGAGVAPSISFSKIFRGEDHVAKIVADALRGLEEMLTVMALEGGYYVDNYFLCATPEAQQALEALIPQAYHGTEEVIMGVRCRRLTPAEQEYIQLHAFTLVPSTREETNPWALEPWKDTSLLTMLQAATYVAPAAFEQGMAVTVREQVPPFAFVPNMPGKVVLGYQYSYERSTGKPTSEPVRMSRELMSNWGFCADTRMGKSVAAERLVFDLVTQENFRVVVMDYGAGWAKMLTALPRDKVDYWGLAPWSSRPIRWNLLQIGQRISPREQMTATVELLCTAGRMGERQAGFMVQTLEELYVEQGVLTFDDEVQTHDKWGRVQEDEWAVLDEVRRKRGLGPPPRRNTWLRDLEYEDLQALAVYRSRRADAREWFDRLTNLARSIRDTTSKSALEGVRLRLQHLIKGQMGQMYGSGVDSIAIEDLAPPAGGLTVLAGGARMSAYARAALLSLMTYHLYTDAVVRREERLEGADYPPLFIVIEEANKVLGGVEAQRGDGAPIQSDIIPAFFRDAGKYQAYLAAIFQSPGQAPPGVLSSCNNLALGQLKDNEDVKAAMSALARSPHGYVDTPYAHMIGDLEVGQLILRMGLARGGRGNYPMLYRPLMVDAREPSPSELREMFRLRGLNGSR